MFKTQSSEQVLNILRQFLNKFCTFLCDRMKQKNAFSMSITISLSFLLSLLLSLSLSAFLVSSGSDRMRAHKSEFVGIMHNAKCIMHNYMFLFVGAAIGSPHRNTCRNGRPMGAPTGLISQLYNSTPSGVPKQFAEGKLYHICEANISHPSQTDISHFLQENISLQ